MNESADVAINFEVSFTNIQIYPNRDTLLIEILAKEPFPLLIKTIDIESDAQEQDILIYSLKIIEENPPESIEMCNRTVNALHRFHYGIRDLPLGVMGILINPHRTFTVNCKANYYSTRLTGTITYKELRLRSVPNDNRFGADWSMK